MSIAHNFPKQFKVPQEWYHKPELQNTKGRTVAMLLICKGVTNIPLEWRHDPTLADKNGWTVAMLLAYSCELNIP